MMSKRSKQELTKEIHPRYLKAKKAEKKKILEEFTAATGYHRKYAIKLLKHGLKRRGLITLGLTYLCNKIGVRNVESVKKGRY